MRRVFISAKLILIGVIAGTLLSGCNSSKELSSYKQGVQALEQQKYSEALDFFKASEAEGAKLQLAYRGEGMAYLGLDQYDDALAAFKLALVQSNGLVKSIDYDINYYMAVAEYKSGKLEDALNTYSNIIAVNKNDADAYYLRGKVNLALSKLDDAKADYDKAIELNKDDSRLYINIYEDLMENGNETDAKAYINSGVVSVAKPTTYELGIFNYYLGDYTQARNYFEESSETKKTEEGIIYLAKTYVALNDVSYATALYEEYTENNKTADIVYNELGLLKAGNKDYEGALAAFNAGLENENPTCKQALMYNRVVAYEMLGNFSEAKKQMEFYLNQFPGDKKALRENIFLSSR